MANQISAVLTQALSTFRNTSKEVIAQNIEVLKNLLDKTMASDVDLPAKFLTDSIWQKRQKAPVTYIDIYEDDLVSMGIFILKPGMKLPLHDHPAMYGLIKVIAGRLKISSFSIQTELNKNSDKMYPDELLVEKHPDIIADPSSQTCVLEPESKNLHEIESMEEPAAFLDILSPPYETPMPQFGPRKCTYFKIIKQLSPKLFNVSEIPTPTWFWNDVSPYTGPELFKQKVTKETQV